ncbi:MAG: hypothetical protein K6A35_08080 [bacterium]|nr:hypothetical protein [bacterium]
MADILPPYNQDDSMLAGLTYPLWPFICPIVFLTDKKNEPFVHFHVLQALAMGGGSFVAITVITLFIYVFLWLLPSGWTTFSSFTGLIALLVFGFVLFFWFAITIYMGWQASSGKFIRLPFLGAWAEEKMQTNLGITEADYATGIIGEKREVTITPFDYEEALERAAESGDSYAKEELEAIKGAEYTESEVIGDPESIEYSHRSSSDITSYLQPDSKEDRATTGASKRTTPDNFQASLGGFRPLAPGANGAVNVQAQAQTQTQNQQVVVSPTSGASSGDFKPLAASFARQPASRPSTGSSVRFNSNFSTPTPETYQTPQAPAANNPSRSQAYGAATPAGRYADSRQYPPGSRPHMNPAGNPAGYSSKKTNIYVPSDPYQAAVDTSQAADSRLMGASRSPAAQQPPTGEGDFTPGIVSRPATRTSRRTFQWSELKSDS